MRILSIFNNGYNVNSIVRVNVKVTNLDAEDFTNLGDKFMNNEIEKDTFNNRILSKLPKFVQKMISTYRNENFDFILICLLPKNKKLIFSLLFLIVTASLYVRII